MRQEMKQMQQCIAVTQFFLLIDLATVLALCACSDDAINFMNNLDYASPQLHVSEPSMIQMILPGRS